MNINLHIERLILEGLPVSHSQGPLVQAAVEAGLVQLLAVDGLSPALRSGGAMPSVRAGNIEVPSENSPLQLGQQIAQAVYQGISR